MRQDLMISEPVRVRPDTRLFLVFFGMGYQRESSLEYSRPVKIGKESAHTFLDFRDQVEHADLKPLVDQSKIMHALHHLHFNIKEKMSR